MNRLLLACALFVLFAVGCNKQPAPAAGNANKPAAVAPQPAAATQSNNSNVSSEKTSTAAKGDVTGAYFVKGSLPADFSEIEHLSLATIDENGNAAPLNGFIRPKRRSAEDYKLVNPKLDGKNLSFTTAAVGGVSYSFNGTFVKLDDFSANPPDPDEVILRGKLTKMVDGNVVKEADVEFTYSTGG